MSELVIPSDTVINDVDVAGADALDAPVATAPKSESGAPVSREEVDEPLYDNPESIIAEIGKTTENLSPGIKGGFDFGTREIIRTAKRVVVKIGLSSLIGSDGRTDPERIDFITDALGKRTGTDDVIIASSGAVASGMGSLGLTSRPSDLAVKQTATAVGQVRLAQEWGRSFLHYGCTSAQVFLISDDAGVRSRARNAQRTIDRLRQLSMVPIVNENNAVATLEFRFGDNDHLVVLINCLACCDALTLLSDADGLYDRNPADPGATLVPEVRGGNDLRGVVIGDGGVLGTGGMVSKVSAARLASRVRIPVLLISASNIGQVLDQADMGATSSAKGNRLSAWEFWMFYVAGGSGLPRPGTGAVDTVTHMRKSLLPVGTTTTDGEFSAGNVVDLISPSGEVIDHGEINYDSEELLGMTGYHTEELSDDARKSVIHIDCLSDFAPRA